VFSTEEVSLKPEELKAGAANITSVPDIVGKSAVVIVRDPNPSISWFRFQGVFPAIIFENNRGIQFERYDNVHLVILLVPINFHLPFAKDNLLMEA
jgi:hypothetical protein